MIVKATKKPFDVQAQKRSLSHYRVSGNEVWSSPYRLQERFGDYKPIGPDMLTEWDDSSGQ